MDDMPLIIKVVQKLHDTGNTVYIGQGKLHYYLEKITEQHDDPLFNAHHWQLKFKCPGIGVTSRRINELNADRWTIMKRDNNGDLEWEMQEDRDITEDIDDDREPILTTILRQRMKKGEQVLYQSIDDDERMEHKRVRTFELKKILRHAEGTKDARTAFEFEQLKTGRYYGLTIPDSLMHLWDLRGDHNGWEIYRIEDAGSESSRKVREELEKDPLIFTQVRKLLAQRKVKEDAMFFYDTEDMGEPAWLEDLYQWDGSYIFKVMRPHGNNRQSITYDREHLENHMTLDKHEGHWMVRYDPDQAEELEEEVDDGKIPLVATLLLQLYNKGHQILIDMGFHGFIGDITRIEEKSDGLNIAYQSTTQGWVPVQKFSYKAMDYCFTLVKKGDVWCFTYTPEFLADLEKQRREKR